MLHCISFGRQCVTTASFWLLLRMCTGHITTSLSKTINFIFLRSPCLTKNYCSKECFAADEAVHVVCCKNVQDVDKRKVKIGGKAKAEMVNKNLQHFQTEAQQQLKNENCSEETRKHMTEALSKIKGLKVKDDKKEQKSSEMD